MAGAAHLSPAHFSREFRRTFGESPHQYLLTRRLERAATLLRTTDWSVARVCLSVGIQSQGTFTTSFGKHFGATPTAYRARSGRRRRWPWCRCASPASTAGRSTARFEKTRRPRI